MTTPANFHLPRVAITYCTQCRWLLRAAYYAQELLTTFGASIGEVALIPATGGLFQVQLSYKDPAATHNDVAAQEVLIWDRKAEGGFPETKILKQKIRNYIEPQKDLGHSDKPSNKAMTGEARVDKSASEESEQAATSADSTLPTAVCADTRPSDDCEDCK
jgi:selT/selW/selH-like putative selenoprotein